MGFEAIGQFLQKAVTFYKDNRDAIDGAIKAGTEAYTAIKDANNSRTSSSGIENPNLNWNSYDDDGFANRYNKVMNDPKTYTAYMNAYNQMKLSGQFYGSFDDFVFQQCSNVKYGGKTTTTNNTYSAYLASTNNNTQNSFQYINGLPRHP